MNKKNIAFAICVGLVAIGAIYCVISDVGAAVGTYVASPNNVVNRFINDSQDVGEIFVEAGEIVSDSGIGKTFDDIVDKYADEVSAEPEIDSTPSSAVNYNDKGTVTRIIDGDTYVLNINGAETKVRLIGIDTPESVAPESYYKENSENGVLISDIVKSAIPEGTTLYIEYDIGRTDTYGRTLAYLYFESGVMVQEWLLSNGYAQVMTIQPNSKYAERFVGIQSVAVQSELGLWNIS